MNPWTVTGSMPFYHIFSSLQARAWVAYPCLGCKRSPRASARSERAVRGPNNFFVQPSHILFVWTERLFAEPTRVRTWVAGSRQTYRKSPLASARSERAVRCSPSFLYALTREGLFAETPSGASLGRGVLAYLQEELPSLCPKQEGRQEFPWLFVRPSRMRVCLSSPPRVQAWVAGSRHICRKSSLASAWSKRAVRSTPGFLYHPRATFLFRRRGLLAEPPRV